MINLKLLFRHILVVFVIMPCFAQEKNPDLIIPVDQLSKTAIDSILTHIPEEEIENNVIFGKKEKVYGVSAGLVAGFIGGALLTSTVSKATVDEASINPILIGGCVGAATAPYFTMKWVRHIARNNAEKRVIYQKKQQISEVIKEKYRIPDKEWKVMTAPVRNTEK